MNEFKIFKYFIALNEDKSPKSEGGTWKKLSDEDFAKEQNIGGVLADNIAVVDFDDITTAECFLKLVKEQKLKTLVIRTDRGMHFYFLHNKKDNLKSISHYINALSLEGDIKTGNRNSYVMIKRQGKIRQTEYGTRDNLEEIPFYLYPIKHLTAGNHSPLLGLKDGEGRNSAISAFKLLLNTKGFTTEQIKFCLGLINRYVLGDPLDERELETLARDESKSEIFKETFGKFSQIPQSKEEYIKEKLEEARKAKKDKEQEEQKRFYLFAGEIVKKYHMLQIKGQTANLLYYYWDNHYILLANKDNLNTLILDEGLKVLGLILTKGEIENKILLYIKQQAPVFTEEKTRQARDLYLALNNKVLVFTQDRKIKVEEPNPRYFCTVKLNIDYKEETEEEKQEEYEVDKFLTCISNEDKETEQLLKELIGYCIFPKNIFRKAFFLLGNGGNGKSTFLNLLRAFLSAENTTSLSLYDIENNRFATANLKDKLANLGDDINSDDFEKLSNFKIITSGDYLSAEFKLGQAFTFSPFCKLIYTCNIAPVMRESNEAIKSRVIYIPFSKKFIKNGKAQEPDYISKITDRRNLTHLLNIALKALGELLENQEFTETEKGRETTTEILREGDVVYSFALDYEAQGKDYDNKPIREVYEKFIIYSKTYFPKTYILSVNMFSRRIRSLYNGLSVKRRLVNNKTVAVFYEEEEIESLSNLEYKEESKEQEKEQEGIAKEEETRTEDREETTQENQGAEDVRVEKFLILNYLKKRKEIDLHDLDNIINLALNSGFYYKNNKEVEERITKALAELGARKRERENGHFYLALPGSEEK